VLVDLRMALRGLRAAPVLSAVTVLSLVIGIGASTAIFALVNSLLLRSLPVHDPERLVLVNDGSTRSVAAWNYDVWTQVSSHPALFERACAFASVRFNLAERGETEFVDGMLASGGFFDALGVSPLLGRVFDEADDVRGGGPEGPVAVISYGFWQKRYRGATALGSPLTVEGIAYTVIGVMPPEFFGPVAGRSIDVFAPLGTEPLIRGAGSFLGERSRFWLTIMLRLRPDQSLESAAAALRGIQSQIRDATLPGNWGPELLATYLNEPLTLVAAASGNLSLRARYERPLLTILAVVMLVLVAACANIGSAQLARAVASRQEWSVRLALGSTRWQVARQVLAESLLLSLLGAGGGLLLAYWGSHALVAQFRTATDRVFLDLSLDWRVIVFTISLTLTATALFGTVPAVRGARANPIDALKERSRSTAANTAVMGSLVVFQVGVALVLLIVAGLLIRSYSGLSSLDPGFDTDRVLTVSLDAQRAGVAPASRLAQWLRVLDAVRAVPGVSAAGMSRIIPVSGALWNSPIEVSGGPVLPARQRIANLNAVTSGWLATYGTGILAGRDIADSDVGTAAPVALVNQAFARKYLDGASPIGRMVTVSPLSPGVAPVPREIVGLVGDAVYRNMRDPVPPTLYVPLTQDEAGATGIVPPTITMSVRAAAGSPSTLTRSVSAAITSVNPNLSQTFRSLEDQVNTSLAQEQVTAILASVSGFFALLIAAVGLYGMTAYAVTLRKGDIGVRLVLGAAPASVVRMVLRRTMLLVCAGLALGAAVSFWVVQLLGSLLYGLEPRDPMTAVGAALGLAVVATAAAWLAARRASGVDPSTLLRGN
jgi:putative ABC transport system permease protein